MLRQKYLQLRNRLLRDVEEHEGWDNPELREELEEWLAEEGNNEENTDYFTNYAVK